MMQLNTVEYSLNLNLLKIVVLISFNIIKYDNDWWNIYVLSVKMIKFFLFFLFNFMQLFFIIFGVMIIKEDIFILVFI